VLCRRLINAYVAANGLQSLVTVLDKSASELTAEHLDFNQVIAVHSGHHHRPHHLSYMTSIYFHIDFHTPEGWKAELTWVVSYILGSFY